MNHTYTHITPAERDHIAHLRMQGMSLRGIAQILGRSPSTICEELARNQCGAHYISRVAQSHAAYRKSQAGKRHPLKNAQTYTYVLEKLRWGWSPEQIAGRLKKTHGYSVISYETIYRFIFAEQYKEKRFWEYLPRKQKKRHKKYGRKSQQGHIPDRVSIHDRPQEVEQRTIVGHWEGDSVEGKAHQGAIHTEVERKTRYLCAVKIHERTKEATRQAQAFIFTQFPPALRKSTTVDNGREFADHKHFMLPVYFADPYSSFQRGTNENTNGLLRRYLPKKTDFSTLTQEELNDIVWEINHRPRKCLAFSTAHEILQQEINKCSASI